MNESRVSTAARRNGSMRLAAFLPALLLALPLPVFAQVATQNQSSWADELLKKETYQRPPKEIADAVLAPRYRNVTLNNASPNRQWFLDEVAAGMPDVNTFGRAHHNLGGFQVDIKATRARTFNSRRSTAINLISATDGTTRAIQIPNGAVVSNASWSPDGSMVAYFAHFDDNTQIYLADASNGRSRALTRSPVLATQVTQFDWTADGKSIITVLRPEPLAPPPPEPVVAQGPQVKMTLSGDNSLRTYADLLQTPYEEQLTEYYLTGQLAKIDVASRRVTNIGSPSMFRSINTSPDGMYFDVEIVQKPFSYIVPVSSFASVEQVWDMSGKVVATLSEREMNVGVQPDSAKRAATEMEPRDWSWRADGQGLSYLQLAAAPANQDQQQAEAGQGGRGNGAARRRDRVMQWTAPFDEASRKVVYENDNRIASIRWSDDARILFLTETTGGMTTESAIYLSDPSKKYTIRRGRGLTSGGGRGFGGGGGGDADIYNDPGNLQMTRGTNGGSVVQLSSDGSSVFLSGTRYSRTPLQEAPKPFIDRVDIKSGNKTRVFDGENADVSEQVSAVLDADATKLIVTRESPKQVADSYLKDGSNPLKKLTNNVDYTPDVTGAPSRRITVTRPDGFSFTVNVLLPPGYTEGTRLPAMFWFYPREYTDQASYDRTNERYDRNAFPNFSTRSMEYLVRLGYAVVQPDAPIIGEAGQMNNNYVNDLRNNLSAVIDELDRRALIDRQRLGIGGHSYGAFSTANALIHTPFFKAGIAGDGNYNRTLTPLNFQTERRDLWDAKDVYIGMSPILWANNMTGALLMYHGLEDQNVGTDPINSPRMFHALNGLGKTAAMYLYPYEDHGPASEETLLDLWARWTAWLDKYVKNAQPPAPKVTTEDGQGSGGN
jgi:dipeptidyl aminopeptidase/acylaminoacyl peptidase